MEIKSTQAELQNLVAQSEAVRNSFTALVLVAPQIIDEADQAEFKRQLDTIASNFETAASMIYEFSRLGIHSKKFAAVTK